MCHRTFRESHLNRVGSLPLCGPNCGRSARRQVSGAHAAALSWPRSRVAHRDPGPEMEVFPVVNVMRPRPAVTGGASRSNPTTTP